MSFLGSLGIALVGSMLSSHSAKKQAQQNADLSRDNWTYQQSNAHQLEVQDLKNAGLNPILSATNSQMAGMSPVQGTDPGNFANNLNSAFQGELERQAKKEMQASDLEIEKLKLENEKIRTQIQRDEADAQISKWHSEGKLFDIQADYTSSKQLNERNESVAKVDQINQDIKNSIKLTDAQASQLYSGAALNNKLADKVIYDILKVVADTEYAEINTKELKRILTDPKREIERKAWSDALAGDNMLGVLHRLNLIGSEVGGMFPSRIGFGFSSKK